MGPWDCGFTSPIPPPGQVKSALMADGYGRDGQGALTMILNHLSCSEKLDQLQSCSKASSSTDHTHTHKNYVFSMAFSRSYSEIPQVMGEEAYPQKHPNNSKFTYPMQAKHPGKA